MIQFKAPRCSKDVDVLCGKDTLVGRGQQRRSNRNRSYGLTNCQGGDLQNLPVKGALSTIAPLQAEGTHASITDL